MCTAELCVAISFEATFLLYLLACRATRRKLGKHNNRTHKLLEAHTHWP